MLERRSNLSTFAQTTTPLGVNFCKFAIKGDSHILPTIIKTHYTLENNACEVFLGQGEGCWLVAQVRTAPSARNKGLATKLMRQVVADADRAGLKLCLDVHASGSMPNAQLERWYRRFGFEYGGEAMFEDMMVCEPGAKAIKSTKFVKRASSARSSRRSSAAAGALNTSAGASLVAALF